MIVGIGIDVVSVARIEKAMENPRFVARILTENERRVGTHATRVAGRWAAKEALAKAIPSLRSWHAVEILNDPSGAPTVRFTDSGLKAFRVHLSITHEKDWAAAVAVVESFG